MQLLSLRDFSSGYFIFSDEKNKLKEMEETKQRTKELIEEFNSEMEAKQKTVKNVVARVDQNVCKLYYYFVFVINIF